MSKLIIEERLAWLEGKSEHWTNLETVMIEQDKQSDCLGAVINDLMAERDSLSVTKKKTSWRSAG